MVHPEFIPFGRIINQDAYLGIFKHLKEALRLKTLKDGKTMTGYFTPYCFTVLGQAFNHTAPSSTLFPRHSSNDFFLYSKLKIKFKRRKFDSVDMIQAESKTTLRNLSKDDFYLLLQQLENKMAQTPLHSLKKDHQRGSSDTTFLAIYEENEERMLHR
ncbi:hypothetical protein LAZ67_12000943 [Cordylochernes scorpioides]|uniref:Uncharacterized protein n=1 Tax=Cordylochernes scorpioides TaxID=51811 RepID=A0ABY6L3M3_9ARAC|nr:hypothetical protein LAZ67_12000943 [Cordylochernes scorpioides]